MKVYFKTNKQTEYVNITKNVDLPILMNFVNDGKYNTLKITTKFTTKNKTFNVVKPFPPKSIIKITDAKSVEYEIENVNTFYFITDKSNFVRLRKEVLDNDGNIIVYGLYEHVINGYEPLYLLEDYHMPNYSVTQPKVKYFDTRVIIQGYRYNINQYFKQEGQELKLLEGNRTGYNSQLNEGQVVSGYDNTKLLHYVDLQEINKASYNIKANFRLAKTAPSYITEKLLGLFEYTSNLNAYSPDYPYDEYKTSNFTVRFKATYYNDLGEEVFVEARDEIVRYTGGEVSFENNEVTSVAHVPSIVSKDFFVKSLSNATNVRVEISIPRVRDENLSYIIEQQFDYFLYSNFAPYGKTHKIVSYIEELDLSIKSSAFNISLDQERVTLYQFLKKATHDYNLNRKNKLTLDDRLEVELNGVMKESEWADFNFKELVERLFRYANIRPILLIDNHLTFSKASEVGRTINLKKGFEQEGEQSGDNYFDRVVSNTKNLVSENDFVQEYVSINSTDTEFAQITETNVGFQTSNTNYFVSEAILYAPDVEFEFKFEDNLPRTINSNIGKPYHWDITKRLFEKDIYESFPDVRYDIYKSTVFGAPFPFNLNNLRSKFDLYGKGNTIYYTSGSNLIEGLMHRAPSIPQLTWGISPTEDLPEYAVIEMLIVLAHQTITAEEETKGFIKTDYGLKTIMNMKLKLTYSPIFKELTTKHQSDSVGRKGINFEKKFNMNEKIVSYEDSSKVLKDEMEMKGNEKELYTEIYNNFEDIIPTHSIVNDNLYITNATISYDKHIKMEYILQKDFMLKNEDIRLPISFERYSVPYEYVKREMMIENFLIFDIAYSEKYKNDLEGSKESLLTSVYSNGNINSLIYAKLDLDIKEGDLEQKGFLMRVAKLTTGSSMILTGTFLDNYSAGTQRYSSVTDEDKFFYSQPLRYTNSNGKVEKVNKLIIGYDNTDIGIKNYDMAKFPEAINDNENNIYGFDNLLFSDTNISLYKDAREGLSFVHTSYLQSAREEIKFYNFDEITKVSMLAEPTNFIDGLTLDDIKIVEGHSELFKDITFESINNSNVYKASVSFNSNTLINDDFINGVVLYNDERLIGLIKGVFVNQNGFEFYVTSTRYGFGYETDKFKFSINDNVYYELGRELFTGDRYRFNIEDNIRYNLNSSFSMGEAYNLNIEDMVHYNLTGAAIHNKKHNFIIEDIINYKLNANAMTNQKYEMSITDNIWYNLSVEATKQKTYNFSITDNIWYNLSAEAIGNQKYEISIIDNIWYNLSVEATPQEKYSFDILDTINYNIVANATPEEKYSFDILDNVRYNLSVEAIGNQKYEISISDEQLYNLNIVDVNLDYDLLIPQVISTQWVYNPKQNGNNWDYAIRIKNNNLGLVDLEVQYEGIIKENMAYGNIYTYIPYSTVDDFPNEPHSLTVRFVKNGNTSSWLDTIVYTE